MTQAKVAAILGGGAPGESTSPGVLGDPSYPYPVDIPKARADERLYYVGPEIGVVVCFMDDKLVAWCISPNRDPLLVKASRVKVGQTYEEARKIMGADESNHYGWNGRFVGRRLRYREGSVSPATGSRSVQIDLQKEHVVSIQQGKTYEIRIEPLPWEDDYDPNYETN